MSDTFNDLKQKLRHFADERDWQQFHSPKNLAMALIVEAAELAEHFQWLKQQESYQPGDGKRQEIGEELADILIYLVRLADRLDIDLADAVELKMKKNEQKYPVEKSRGSAKKSTDYQWTP